MSIPFTNQTQVTVSNPFAPGPVEAVVKDQDGVRLWCGEDYSNPNQVTVAFDRALSGSIDLIGDSGGGGGGGLAEYVEDAVIGSPARAVIG